MWDQPGLATIQRRWRAIADEYADTPEGPRMFVAEAYLPHDRLVRYLEPDRLHTSFNFEFLISAWKANSLRTTITESLTAHESVGASATWVLGNHDNVRPVSRYGKEISGLDFSDPSAPHAQFHGTPTDVALGRCRARAAAMLELALPGGATFTKAKSLVSQRSKIFPKKPSKTPPGNVLVTQIAVVTDVAFPCRGAVPIHPMGGRQTRTPGSPCRVIGPSGPSNLNRTIRHPSLCPLPRPAGRAPCQPSAGRRNDDLERVQRRGSRLFPRAWFPVHRQLRRRKGGSGR
ncbi:alpha-glucosidase [Cutibacterium acnes JCM 18909]|nr:alpha-glucosidase [Cutibacterium acnes JCM 18909]